WDEIVYTIGGSLARDAKAVEGNQADYTPFLPHGSSSYLARRYGPGSAAAKHGLQQFFTAPTLTLTYLALNTRRPIFGTRAPRRAVNSPIDRTRFAHLSATPETAAGFAPTDQYVPPAMAGIRTSQTYGLHADIREARHTFQFNDRVAVLYTCDDSA